MFLQIPPPGATAYTCRFPPLRPLPLPLPTPFIWGSPLLLEMKSRDYLIIILFLGFSRQEYWILNTLPFPFPVKHNLSELSTMTHPSWMAPHSMAHSFTELDMAVVHVIKLISFLWLWFSVCLSSSDWRGNWVLFRWAEPCSVNP